MSYMCVKYFLCVGKLIWILKIEFNLYGLLYKKIVLNMKYVLDNL